MDRAGDIVPALLSLSSLRCASPPVTSDSSSVRIIPSWLCDWDWVWDWDSDWRWSSSLFNASFSRLSRRSSRLVRIFSSSAARLASSVFSASEAFASAALFSVFLLARADALSGTVESTVSLSSSLDLDFFFFSLFFSDFSFSSCILTLLLSDEGGAVS
jgi:hypothetical protein